MNPPFAPHRRHSRFLNSLICFARYHLRELKYEYYEFIDELHDALAAHPLIARQCGVAACGLLGGAVATFAVARAFNRDPKR